MSMAIFSQRCRHADGGLRISGRRQLVQRGGKPAPYFAPTVPVTISVVCIPTSAGRRCTLAGTRENFARRDDRTGPASSTRSTASFRVRALHEPARSRSGSRIAVKH
ncbi:unnamed protein product [Lasius platythorax]|uniref:Uncharacterized protein n=1 Tax=Lasius platythorax TaxID=488582 RepID=A0AAV2N361_9HYME